MILLRESIIWRETILNRLSRFQR